MILGNPKSLPFCELRCLDDYNLFKFFRISDGESPMHQLGPKRVSQVHICTVFTSRGKQGEEQHFASW